MSERYGRLFAVALCGGFIFLQLCIAQQSPARPAMVLTPEQKALQQQSKEYAAKRVKLQAQAKQVFDEEMAREKAGDCPDAQTTYDFNICFGKQAAITDQNLKSFEGIIRELNAPPPQMPGAADTDTPGVAGISLTPEHLLAEFDRVEQSWRQYREMACTAAFHQFGGGTGGPSFGLQCELTLARSHMRELWMIYGMDLRL